MASWLIVAVIAFVVLGPKQMPSAVRKAARLVGKLQRTADEFKRQLMSMDSEIEKEAKESFEETVGKD